MSGDLTQRLYAAAETGTTPEAITRAVCREAARWLGEERTLFTAKRADSDGGLRPGDDAHASVIAQIGDHLARVGDERHPS
ncbi:MAG TPA: hypothetical protein VFW27_38845 [Actinoplanes sp.]|nr:hypothetical protein [Actinoplanes sp.]